MKQKTWKVIIPILYTRKPKIREECVIRWKCSMYIPSLNLPSLAEYFTNRMRLELKAINMAPSKNVYIVDKEHNLGWPQHLLSISLFSNCLKEKNKFMSNPVGKLKIMQIPLICEEHKFSWATLMAIANTKTKKTEEYKRNYGERSKWESNFDRRDR